MPMSLVERIQNASTFNEGFSTVETISVRLVDMKLHQLEDLNINPKEYEDIKPERTPHAKLK